MILAILDPSHYQFQDVSGKEHTIMVPVGFSQSLASQEICEETQQILEQIQNHIDSRQQVVDPDGQPVEVSYGQFDRIHTIGLSINRDFSVGC